MGPSQSDAGPTTPPSVMQLRQPPDQNPPAMQDGTDTEPEAAPPKGTRGGRLNARWCGKQRARVGCGGREAGGRAGRGIRGSHGGRGVDVVIVVIVVVVMEWSRWSRKS